MISRNAFSYTFSWRVSLMFGYLNMEIYTLHYLHNPYLTLE